MTATTPKKKNTSRKFVKKDYNFRDEPLSILFSSRIRLTQPERDTLKKAYEEASRGEVPVTKPAIGNSSVTTQTSYGSCPELEYKLGMSRTIAYDLINTRDSIPVPVVLKLQKVLGVSVLTPERLQECFDNYVHFLFMED